MLELNTTINEIFSLLFASLKEEKANILIDRYLRDKTLQEIADTKGITRERIRQIEARSIQVYYDFLKFRGYKYDMDIIFKRAASKLQPISSMENNSKEYTNIDKYNFVLKISTKFSDSLYKIDTHRSLNTEFYSKKDFDFEIFINSFKEEYRTNKLNTIKNINSRFGLNLDEGFLSHFNNISQMELPELENLFDYKIQDFEENRLEKIERFFRNRGREASISEIVDATGLNERQVRSAIDCSEKIVNIGKSIYGHVENGYKQGTTEELVLKFIKANSPTTVYKIKRYINSERFVQESTVSMALTILSKKGLIKKIDDEYHFIKDNKNLDDKDIKSKIPKIKKGTLDPFKELFRFKINEHKEIIVSEVKDFIRIGDYVKSNKYEGLTKSGVVIKKNQIDVFLDNVNKTLNTGLQTSMPWNNMENAELLIRKEEKIPSSGSYYIDLRQFIKSKNFEGFTKKGIRIDEKVFKDFFDNLRYKI